jgi:osmoprotectant transport system permease protein
VILGIVLTRPSMRRVCEPVMQVLSIATAIPTLAIIALAMMALGVGRAPALVALFLHALLPIVRNTVEGLRQLPSAELESARGMGMTPSQTLFLVELPGSAADHCPGRSRCPGDQRPALHRSPIWWAAAGSAT